MESVLCVRIMELNASTGRPDSSVCRVSLAMESLEPVNGTNEIHIVRAHSPRSPPRTYVHPQTCVTKAHDATAAHSLEAQVQIHSTRFYSVEVQ